MQIITHNGRKIVLVDCSDMAPDKTMQALFQRAAVLIRSQEPASVRVLCDVSYVVYSYQTIILFRDFAGGNAPYVKASALVGIDGLKRLTIKWLSRILRRSFNLFETRQEAMDWLVEQE